MRTLQGGIAAAVGLCAITAVLLTGCSGSAPSGASSGAAGAAPAPRAAGGAAQAAGAGGNPGTGGTSGTGHAGAASGAGPAGPTGPTGRLASSAQLIYTAGLTVRVTDLGRAVPAAAQIVTAAGGYVSNENSVTDPAHPGQSTASLQLRVPVAAYPATLARLASQLGRQVSVQQQAQDVTQQVADTNSRVASDQAAISQLRALLARTGSVADLLSVQNQINAQESDLESMQSQQRALNGETSYATVSLSLLGPAAAPRPAKPKPPPGLTGGLVAGWHALRATLSWLLAILGAAAPIAAVVAVIGYAGYRGRRWLLHRLHGRPPASAPAGD
jgi:hypothetical protein